MPVDKVIVTNTSALKAKYGDKYDRVKSAIDRLIAADAVRGLKTRLIAIDAEADMKRLRAQAVVGIADQQGAKAAVDAIYKRHQPDYILLLGASDVVPHIDLSNPMTGTADDDDDPTVPSDVPYACDKSWSRRPEDFVGPTRVVGRLPDLTGGNDPAYLVKLLGTAANYVARDRAAYTGHLAITAKLWTKSTTETLTNLFGEESKVLTSPPNGPNWTADQLAARLHFINCHGDTVSPEFFGEFPKGRFPVAHRSSRLPGRIKQGSVVAAECCYGAELYDPRHAAGQPGLCSTYLAQGAYGFLGSTNIAYGPSEGQGQADLICQYFVESVLKGASLGRAALEARQRFVAQFSHVDPSDLKTAVQFILLGDPSVQAVKAVAHAVSRTRAVKSAVRSGRLRSDARGFRRERLVRTGSNLSRTMGAAIPAAIRISPAIARFLRQTARESGIQRPVFRSYRVSFPRVTGAPEIARLRDRRRNRTIHMAIGSRVARPASSQHGVSAIIVTIEAGRIAHVRRVHSR
jgi:hypothetical protein